eukprot:3944583-Amphidinium_carterae.1
MVCRAGHGRGSGLSGSRDGRLQEPRTCGRHGHSDRSACVDAIVEKPFPPGDCQERFGSGVGGGWE